MNTFTPQAIEFHDADDIFFKRYTLPKDALVPQHAHDYDHTTLIAKGRIRVWCDGDILGDVESPQALLIRAGAKHTFLALEESVLYCIHNMRGREDYKISEEHELWHSA